LGVLPKRRSGCSWMDAHAGWRQARSSLQPVRSERGWAYPQREDLLLPELRGRSRTERRNLSGNRSDTCPRAGQLREPSRRLGSPLKVVPVDPAASAPFPNAIIPPSRWSPVAARILGYPQFPVPNASPLITTPGAYINTVANRVQSDKFDIRIDHYLSSKW